MTPGTDVLIVDDDPIAHTIYKSYLATIGVRATHRAATGAHAVQCLKDYEGRIGLIVLDLNMPEMDGIELIGHLHKLGYTGRLAIGSGSHQANRESAQKLAEVYGLNLIGFISKPLTKTKLENVFGSDPLPTRTRLAG